MAGRRVRFAVLPAAIALLLAGSVGLTGIIGMVEGHAATGETSASKKKSAAKKKKKKRVRKCRSTRKGPVYRSPGYAGRCKVRGVTQPPPLPSTRLSGSGRLPDMLVDDAGTAHIVWTSEGGTGPDLLNYCRIKRGSQSCDNPGATRQLFPPQPGSPQFNDDSAGPKVLAVGDELALLSHRYPNVVPTPLGTSDSNTYLWLSDDGGDSFAGPGLVGDSDPSGDAVVFGSAEAPRIGVISDTRTGGTFFQAISPGAYSGTQANLGEGGPDRAYSGSLSVVGQRPVAAFADLGNRTYIRQWNGSGSPNDTTNWSQTQVNGREPKLAAGPLGSFIAMRSDFGTPVTVSRLNGITPGPPVPVTGANVNARDLVADDGGALRLAWVDGSFELSNEVRMRTSFDGTGFGPGRVIARASGGASIGDDAIGQVKIGSAADGGGFATYVAGGGVVGTGRVEFAPFGNQQANGQQGLGGRPGGGAAPGTEVSCQEISYGAVQILSPEGCLLGVAGQAAKLSEGPVRINGLEIIPDAGVRIRLGTRERTIDTTGRVTVQIQAPGGPIVLFYGELHLRLPSGNQGVRLATFDTSRFPVNLKGFPVQGEIDVILREKSVEIPLSLKLPKVFGGLTGNMTLRASNRSGLEASSMRFGVSNLILGPVVLRNLDISWDGGSTWSGEGTVVVAGAVFSAGLEFRDGAFNRGSVEVTPVPFPGLPVFTDVFLNRINGSLQLDPFEISAGGVFGFRPIAPPDVYTVGIDSKLRITTRPVFAIEVTGTGDLAKLPLSESRIRGDANGYFSLFSRGRIDLGGIISAGSEINGFVDAGRGRFGAAAAFDGCVGTSPARICSGFAGLVSSNGIAGCASGFIGFGYRWKGGAELLGPPSCSTSDYEVRPAAAVSRATGSGRAGESGIVLPAGLPSASIRLTGAGGPPEVVVVSPTGERLTPVPVGADGAVSAPVTSVTGDGVTQIGLRRPAAGNWKFDPQTGPAITEVAVSRGLSPPKVSAKVKRSRGKGAARKRVLTFKATSRSGLVVSFFERVGGGGRLIGTTSRKSGRLTFSSADGPAGKRAIVAQVEQDGLPVLQRQVASYRSPGPVRPARVKGLKVRRKGGGITIRWRRAAGSARYGVRTRISDGRVLMNVTGRNQVRISGVGRRDRVRVTVTGQSAAGRSGKPASVKFPR